MQCLIWILMQVNHKNPSTDMIHTYQNCVMSMPMLPVPTKTPNNYHASDTSLV